MAADLNLIFCFARQSVAELPINIIYQATAIETPGAMAAVAIRFTDVFKSPLGNLVTSVRIIYGWF